MTVPSFWTRGPAGALPENVPLFRSRPVVARLVCSFFHHRFACRKTRHRGRALCDEAVMHSVVIVVSAVLWTSELLRLDLNCSHHSKKMVIMRLDRGVRWHYCNNRTAIHGSDQHAAQLKYTRWHCFFKRKKVSAPFATVPKSSPITKSKIDLYILI